MFAVKAHTSPSLWFLLKHLLLILRLLTPRPAPVLSVIPRVDITGQEGDEEVSSDMAARSVGAGSFSWFCSYSPYPSLLSLPEQ